MLARITGVRHVGGHRLELTFSSGERAELDFEGNVKGRGGVFAALEDVDFFGQVSVDPEVGTIVWPNGVDFCPDVLYSRATGKPLPGHELQPREE